MRYLIIGWVVAAILLAGSLASARTVEAKCPNPGPPRSDNYPATYWSGMYGQLLNVLGQPIGVGGIYARLDNRTVWVEPNTQYHQSAAWVQIKPTSTVNMRAQAGWLEKRYGARNDFILYFTSDNYNTRTLLTYSPQPIGDSSFYTVLDNPNQWQASGEINSRANQMPGGYAIGMYFNELHVWNGVPFAWVVPTWYAVINSNSSWFAAWGSPLNGVGIWDWSCYD